MQYPWNLNIAGILKHFFLFMNNIVFSGRLQTEILQQTLENEDELLIAIAGIKQV